MARAVAICFLVLCTISDLAAGARLGIDKATHEKATQESKEPNGDKDKVDEMCKMFPDLCPEDYDKVGNLIEYKEEASSTDCKKEIMQIAEQISFRVGAFFGPGCNAQIDGTQTLTEEGKSNICSLFCINNEMLAGEPPHFRDVESRCTDDVSLSNLKAAKTIVPLHDHLTESYLPCHQDLPSKTPDTTPETEDPEEEDPIIDSTPTTDDETTSPGDLMWPTRGFVAQMRLSMRLNNGLAVRTIKTCEILTKVFREFDYQSTGRLTRDVVDGQLDRLSYNQKKETMKEFDALQDRAINSGYVTFMDVVQKLPVNQAFKCLYAYSAPPQ